ncbi:hypothetical protein NMT12_40003 [metagenome]
MFRQSVHYIQKFQALDKIRAEITVSTCASLTVERQVPNITTSVVDLG